MENNNKKELSTVDTSLKKTENSIQTEFSDQNTQPLEKNITEESDKLKEAETDNEIKEETQNSKLKSPLFIGIISLIILFLLGFIFSSLFSNSEKSYETLDANKVIHEQENPTLKATKLNPNKVYVLKDATQTLNNLTVDIKKIQFRKDQTRLWVQFKNEGSNKIQMMPNVNATLVDNNGHSYKVDSFAGNQMTGLAPSVSEEVMLVFAPIRAEAKEITFHLDMVFDMKNPAWQVEIPVSIPE